jgi:hypothetical protein
VFLAPEVQTVPHATNKATNANATIRVTSRDILIFHSKTDGASKCFAELEQVDLNSVNDSHVSNIAYKMHLYFPPLHLIP